MSESSLTKTMTTPRFEKLTATAVPLGKEDVDTDQIIPARFLKGVVRTGLGEHLFNDWRKKESGAPKPDFVLNDPTYQGAKILVARNNFGCGSSREHAVWALMDYGFRAVLAISFADIFQGNALKNGLLPIALSAPLIDALLDAIKKDPATEIQVDLPAEQVTLLGKSHSFEVDPFRKKCLLEGLDDIGYTLRHADLITHYESTHLSF